eukprot:CAMPEP_0172496586 /NCGR_PEP_ID=MMETSP1066-20121228/89807_1 /TAXON_ID=671091 /ORGANISM="Coscinodiscus wailesii, Strain CCMP2513" /LENGTH=204 /DNA_ID=CAMNT_0013268957 /DNA_START=24 /DNA_END=638 /DNA_ORIENTATION=+
MSTAEKTPLLSEATAVESSSDLYPHDYPIHDDEVTRTPYVTKEERRRDENSIIPSRPVTKRQQNGTHSPDDKDNIMNKEINPLDQVGTMLKPRRAPVKIEPKVFFANERTLMAWTHLSVWLATGAVTILGFAEANPQSQMYGITLVPVALSFMLYAIIQYVRRARMIRRKDPGPYDDTFGPILLGIVMILTILSQFAIKIYTWL